MKKVPKYKLLYQFNLPRIYSLMQSAIRQFRLNLQGVSVLTEAASGYYMLTPLIAALGSAEHVYALTKDSRYGKASDIREATLALADYWGMGSCVEILDLRRSPKISRADIITNLGHVRPLNREFLKRLKKTAVIPLMWEAWEHRPSDLDLGVCKKLGIPVLATNEEHRYLKTFKYIGYLVIKLLFEANIEVLGSKIVVIGSGKFAVQSVKTLQIMEAQVKLIKAERLLRMTSSEAVKLMDKCDAIIVAEHTCDKQLIGRRGPLTANLLCKVNPGMSLIHIAGNVDEKDIKASGIRYFPKQFASPGHMSVTTDHIGPRPLIYLHTAGLKIGEVMARARLKGHRKEKVEKIALKTGFAQSLT